MRTGDIHLSANLFKIQKQGPISESVFQSMYCEKITYFVKRIKSILSLHQEFKQGAKQEKKKKKNLHQIILKNALPAKKQITQNQNQVQITSQWLELICQIFSCTIPIPAYQTNFIHTKFKHIIPVLINPAIVYFQRKKAIKCRKFLK